MTRRIRTQGYNNNLYLTSNQGVLKIQNTFTPTIYAGLPRGLDLDVQTGGGGSWLNSNSSVAYRLIWGIKDLNDNYIYGPPSQRIVYVNSGAATSTQLSFFIPDGITSSHFFQIYRSRQIASTTTDPGDELFLTYERNPTIAEIAAGNVAFSAVTDLTSDSLLGAALYTNATQEGIINENTAPPYCRDMCLYREHMIYAYTKLKNNLTINLIGSDGGINGQTITIAGITYTASTAAENILTGTFLATTAGTPASNIDATARSLIRVINRYSANTFIYAYYISGYNDVPGKIYLESRHHGDSPWFVVGSAGMSQYWTPRLSTSQISTLSSSNSDSANMLIISKPSQPEHVPYANSFPVGPKNEAIQRVIALRDSVIIFKDRSIWRLVGTGLSDFQISLLDNTVSITSRDSVSVLNNMALALTNQGVVAVSDNGVQIISRQIEYDILANVRQLQTLGLNHDAVIGQGHESDRLYVLCMQALPDVPVYNSALRICYVYNYLTNSWTRWFLNANCFSVLNDRIYYGLNNNVGAVLKQRNGYADYVAGTYPAEMEFCDPAGALTVSAVNTNNNSVTATFTDAVDYNYPLYGNPDKGWIIFDQVRGEKHYLKSVVGPTYFFDSVTNLTTTTYNLYRNIKMDVLYNDRTDGDSFQYKQYNELNLDLGTMFAYDFDVGFINENDLQDQPISSYSTTNYSAFTNPDNIQLNDFTLNAFVTPSYQDHNIQRTWVAADRQYSRQLCVQIKNQTAGCRFEVKGIGLSTRATGSYKG